MNSLALRAIPRVGAPVVARSKNLEQRLRRFPARVRPRVLALAARHPRLADLAASFPALLFALAVPNGRFRAEAVIQDVIAGRDLKFLAERAGLAMWMRKLKPEMLQRPLPALPIGHEFSRRIVNHIPPQAKFVANWLDAIAFAERWGHEDFALWYASNFPTRRRLGRNLALLTLWAWFSARPETWAHAFLEKPWNSHIRYKAALDAANEWIATIGLYANLGDRPIDDMWHDPGVVDGYEFVPLRSAAEVVEEAHVMKNCLRTYGYDLAHDHSRFWSIRTGGARVATVQVGWWSDYPLLYIMQLQAHRNRRAPREVWLAAARWIRQREIVREGELAWDTVPLDRAIWFALWKPYWLEKKKFPSWLPLTPSRRTLDEL
ncbi:MAG TPA: hypothetical protein VMD53_15140 [Rhizomicrobium sp.]|nr:hypothetical protein [Rhizomicrobium sp.]